MKKLFAAFAIVGFAAVASAQTISFDKTTYEYGTVKTGSEGHRYFTVKNTGDKPLILSEVKASCGCTTPEWSKEPIMPGKTAKIKVGYNTQINGEFQKSIDVYSNDPVNGRSVIFIKGKVDPNASEVAVANANENSDVVKAATGKPKNTGKKAPAKKRVVKK
ncbi:DUF1573 domain-containing protein [uncultured Chryseobacterium sp.]|uniref:DUF1573 domain-containing protein n=1 Tax=uncultured Chryseobacterium sp. TaxID=259322 RepID=UPI00261AA92E|nr:DUF1573 domain-containing protein [uncultured Chryseobacterium sp.]